MNTVTGYYPCVLLYRNYVDVSYCISHVLKSAKAIFGFFSSDIMQITQQTKRVFMELEVSCGTLIFTLETFSLPSKVAKSWFHLKQSVRDIRECDVKPFLKVANFSSNFFRGIYYGLSSINGVICKPLAFIGKFYSLSEVAKEIADQSKVLQTIGQVAKLLYLISDILRGKKVIRNSIESIVLIAFLVLGILVIAKVTLPLSVIVIALSVSVSLGLFKAWERAYLISQNYYYVT